MYHAIMARIQLISNGNHFFQLLLNFKKMKLIRITGIMTPVSFVNSARSMNSNCPVKRSNPGLWRYSMIRIAEAKKKRTNSISFRPGIQATVWLKTG
jgi:hypothetical protein